MIASLLLSCLAAAPPQPTMEAHYRTFRERAMESQDWHSRDRVKPFLAYAVRFHDDPTAIEALLDAHSFTWIGAAEFKEAAKRLEPYTKGKLVEPIFRNLGLATGPHHAAFLKKVGDTNPDRRLRALAWRAMLNGRQGYLDQYKRWDLAKMEPAQAKFYRGEIEALDKDIALAKNKLAGLKGAIPDLSVGSPGPDCSATTLDGKPASLSSLRGKVVVLDFWFIKCGPCRKVVPKANALLAEMKGRPFAQVGVATDLPQALREHLPKADMPWTHWRTPYGSRFLVDWDVEAYPTIYVIDHEGIIRHRQVGFDPKDDKITPLVRELVKKAEGK